MGLYFIITHAHHVGFITKSPPPPLPNALHRRKAIHHKSDITSILAMVNILLFISCKLKGLQHIKERTVWTPNANL